MASGTNSHQLKKAKSDSKRTTKLNKTSCLPRVSSKIKAVKKSAKKLGRKPRFSNYRANTPDVYWRCPVPGCKAPDVVVPRKPTAAKTVENHHLHPEHVIALLRAFGEEGEELDGAIPNPEASHAIASPGVKMATRADGTKVGNESEKSRSEVTPAQHESRSKSAAIKTDRSESAVSMATISSNPAAPPPPKTKPAAGACPVPAPMGNPPSRCRTPSPVSRALTAKTIQGHAVASSPAALPPPKTKPAAGACPVPAPMGNPPSRSRSPSPASRSLAAKTIQGHAVAPSKRTATESAGANPSCSSVTDSLQSMDSETAAVVVAAAREDLSEAASRLAPILQDEGFAVGEGLIGVTGCLRDQHLDSILNGIYVQTIREVGGRPCYQKVNRRTSRRDKVQFDSVFIFWAPRSGLWRISSRPMIQGLSYAMSGLDWRHPALQDVKSWKIHLAGSWGEDRGLISFRIPLSKV